MQFLRHRPRPDRAREATANPSADLGPQEDDRNDHRDIGVRDGRLRADPRAHCCEAPTEALEDLRHDKLSI